MTDPKTKCPENWDPAELLAYLDGELKSNSCRKLEEHLKLCPICSEELESTREMASLLREHPESFHPDEEDLYRFVAEGKDDTNIAEHVASCQSCRDEVELLRELIGHRGRMPVSSVAIPEALRNRLGHADPSPRSDILERLMSALRDSLRFRFRMPALALGTVAAAVVVVAVCLPLWRSFEEPSILTEQPLRPSQSVEGSAQEPQRQLVPPDRDKQINQPGAAGNITAPEAATQAASEPRPRKADVRSTDRKGEMPSPVQGLKKTKEEAAVPADKAMSVAKPKPASPPAESKTAHKRAARHGPGYHSSERHDRLESVESRRPPQRPAPAAVGPLPSEQDAGLLEARRERSASAEAARDGSKTTPVTIRIVDGQGQSIPWPQASIPPDMVSGYVISLHESPEQGVVQARTSTLRNTPADAEKGHGQGFKIEIRLLRSGEEYEVESRLLDAFSLSEIASLPAIRTTSSEASSAVASQVRRLLEDR